MKKNKCPYCGRELSFFESVNIKENLEYYCENCENKSDVRAKKSLKTLITMLIILTAVCVLVFSFIFRMLIIGSVIISGLFVLFYTLVPGLIILKRKES